ncbi:MAG TPA: enoyl-ACP reductase FabV [Candidatus Acidoferrales bacterium]|nr:enoyl-ACP reductase FabV [Candidatus Acidoferrales bacterium]
MPAQVVTQRSRGFICVNAHPEGCAKNVERQVQEVRTALAGSGGRPAGIRNALVIGASTGYGMASRVALGWGYGARTLGVFFERPPEGDRTATAGWYNTAAFHRLAQGDGLHAASLNTDAFADEAKRAAIEILKREMAPVDLVVYSLASPKRTHPRTGVTHNSTLKPIGKAYTNKTIDLGTKKVQEITIQPASDQEIADTVAVMGGEDWKFWIEALLAEGLLAEGARTVAYSYIGPTLTWPIYWDGTIGRAKLDLEKTATELETLLAKRVKGHAWISVNKAIVTQASSAIPVVPLYMSLLFKVMQQEEIDEDAAAQMRRLFLQVLAAGKPPATDGARRIRLDDREMRADVQAEVGMLWPQVTSENLAELSDFAGFDRGFKNLFGFEVDGVDYAKPVETDIRW